MRKNIFGLIGYTVLSNVSNNNKMGNKMVNEMGNEMGNKMVLVMADRHDDLPPCNVDYNKVSEWLKSKFNIADILLEEVKRDKDTELGELWATSEHTQELKELYLNNTNTVIPIDIRNNYIAYSWELYDKNEVGHNIMFYQYLIPINKFFSLTDDKFKKNISLYDVNYLKNNLLGVYFLIIKDNYRNFLNKYKDYLYEKIDNLINNTKIFLDFNNLLHSLLEWYSVALLIYSTKNRIIIHTGLAHSSKIVYFLQTIFNYKIIDEQGVNKLKDLNKPITSCFLLPSDIAKQFGGFVKFK